MATGISILVMKSNALIFLNSFTASLNNSDDDWCTFTKLLCAIVFLTVYINVYRSMRIGGKRACFGPMVPSPLSVTFNDQPLIEFSRSVPSMG